MLNDATVNKLFEMRLNGMAENYSNQLGVETYDHLSFEERFGMIVDLEWAKRKSNKLNRLINKAGFRFKDACIENIEYHSDRNLNQSQINRLATCDYITHSHNILIMGASGNGKSYISCAFGVAACRSFYSVRYIRLPELLDELTVARGEGIFQKVISKYKKVNLLILDEWLLTPLRGDESRDLLELIESRHQVSSTIFCSQFSPGGWHEMIGQDTLADAILDRIVHDSYKILLKGKRSMREKYGIKE
jgi:DNA replication protein DnaC